MAINAYTGLMGSGKSYEVVENVILPALLAGRRVVTNVANLQVDDITAYLTEKFNATPDKVGQIVQVQNEDIDKPNFFPVETPADTVAPPPPPAFASAPAPVSTVQPGDLVVVDECWRWWAAGAKISPAHMTFFRMHRHFVNLDTKATCDMVLVVQDISDLDRKLKVVVENTYRMSKHKALGSTTRYRVDIYTSYKTTKSPYRSLQRKYNKEIFALYQSYSQGGGQSGNEVAIDGRANIFKGALFRLVLPLMLIMFGFAVWQLWGFFHPAPPKTAAPDKAKSAPGQPANQGASGTPATKGTPSANQSPATSTPATNTDESPWRVAGHYTFGLNTHVVITRGAAVRTLINPRGFYYDALRAYGTLDGSQLTNYTGMSESSSLLPESKK